MARWAQATHCRQETGHLGENMTDFRIVPGDGDLNSQRKAVCYVVSAGMNLLKSDAFTDGLAKIISAEGTRFAASATKQLTESIVPDLVSDLLVEVAKSSVEAYTGPLIKLLFRIVSTEAKLSRLEERLGAILDEPVQTGLRVANEAVELESRTSLDEEFVRNRLAFALNKLDEAYTLASTNNAAEVSLAEIRFYQCVIAVRMGAIKGAEGYFSEISRLIESEIGNLELNVERWQATVRVLTSQYKAKDEFILDDAYTQAWIRKLAKLKRQDRETVVYSLRSDVANYELRAANLKTLTRLFTNTFGNERFRSRVSRDTRRLVMQTFVV
jgi:hypothetical protein